MQVLEMVQDEHKERDALPEERVADTEKGEAVDGLQVLPKIRTSAVAAQWDRSRSHSRGMEALKVRQDDEKMRAENCTSRKPEHVSCERSAPGNPAGGSRPNGAEETER